MELTKANAAHMTSTVHAYTPNTPHKKHIQKPAGTHKQNTETHDWSTGFVIVWNYDLPQIALRSHTLDTLMHAHTYKYTHTQNCCCLFFYCVLNVFSLFGNSILLSVESSPFNYFKQYY